MFPRWRDLEDAVETPRVPTAEKIPVSELRAEVATVIAGPRTASPASHEDEPAWETSTRIAGPAPVLLHALRVETLDDELARLAKRQEATDCESRIRCIAADSTTHDHDGEDDGPTLLVEPAPRTWRSPSPSAFGPPPPMALLSEREISALSAAFQVPPASSTRDDAMASVTPERSWPVCMSTSSVRAGAGQTPQVDKTVWTRQRSPLGWLGWLSLVTLVGAGVAVGIAHWHVALHLVR
jgi:hypothetical protein